ncbi:MAG: hypothetical protein ACK6CU_32005, partial [Deltaproteobacteria bacterium]
MTSLPPSRIRSAPPERSAGSLVRWAGGALAAVLLAPVVPNVARAQQEPLWSTTPASAASMCFYEAASSEEGVVPPADPAPSPLDLAASHPLLADRFELLHVERELERLRHEAGAVHPNPSLCALEAALASPSSAVAARARVMQVRCLLLVDDPSAPESLEALLRRYPELPDEVALRLEQARSLARRGRHAEAAAAFRAIDLAHPGATEGRLAREGLAALLEQGHEAVPLS